MGLGQERLQGLGTEVKKVLSSVSTFAKRFREISPTEKVSAAFLIAAGTDFIQAMTNRMFLNFNPLLGTVETMSDMGMVFASSNLVNSPHKKAAIFEGALGMVGSMLIKTGNPDLVVPALAAGFVSVALGGKDYIFANMSLLRQAYGIQENTPEK